MTKILLVEDDKGLREIYGVRLLAEGYDILSAGDGEEALAMAIKDRPSLIISDVMMPKISGFDMLDILRSTTETRDIKVIMMTALSSEEQRQRGENLGADRYLVKSQVGIEDVVRTVHDVLADRPTNAAPQTSTQVGTPTFTSGQPTPVQPTPQTNVPQPAPQQSPVAPQTVTLTPQQPVPPATQTISAPSQPATPPAPVAPIKQTPNAPHKPNLSERVIQPIREIGESQSNDIADLMAKELSSQMSSTPAAPQQQPSPTPATSTPPANPVPIAPLPTIPPVVAPKTSQPQPATPPSPSQPQANSTVPEPSVNYEETPRPTTSAPAQQTTPR